MLTWLSPLWLAPQKNRKKNERKNIFVFVEAQETI